MPWYDWWPYEPNKPHSPQLNPYFVELEEKTTYLWCACGKSNTQPWCDGSHKGTGYKPLPFIIRQKRSALICGCKFSERRPYCNLTHLHVQAHKNTPLACATLFTTAFILGLGS